MVDGSHLLPKLFYIVKRSHLDQSLVYWHGRLLPLGLCTQCEMCLFFLSFFLCWGRGENERRLLIRSRKDLSSWRGKPLNPLGQLSMQRKEDLKQKSKVVSKRSIASCVIRKIERLCALGAVATLILCNFNTLLSGINDLFQRYPSCHQSDPNNKDIHDVLRTRRFWNNESVVYLLGSKVFERLYKSASFRVGMKSNIVSMVAIFLNP